MIDHVEIQVANFAKCAPFWDWLLPNCLGWKAVLVSDDRREWEGRLGKSFVVVKAGEETLAPEHIALAAPSLGAFDAAWNHAQKHGATRLYEDEHPHAAGDDRHAAYFVDPVGIKVEVVWNPIPDPVFERLKALSDEDLVARWFDLLNRVRKELRWLSDQRNAMETVTTQVINQNPRLLEHSGRTFLDMMRTWYAGAMALAYRRQDDNDDRTASLRVVLDELLARPSAFRLDTVKPFAGPAATDEVVGTEVLAPVLDADGNLNEDLIRQHRLDLTAVGERVRYFANKFIAHTNAEAQDRPEGANVSFSDIYAAHKECERIAEVWLKAFGVYRFPLDPEQQIDWLDVFDFPWRLRKPKDEPDSRKYIVTVHPCLDEAETEGYFASLKATTLEKRRQAHLEDLGRAADGVQSLTLDERNGTYQVIPNIIGVERLT